MTTSDLNIDYRSLQEEGLISVREHKLFPLRILNYTAKAQYDGAWDRGINLCRGLIIDDKDNIIARPFPKFFNIEESQADPPDEPFVVFNKYDGSLGIMYWWGDSPYIATRGSFHSEQADEANKILSNYPTSHLSSGLTYLFEIIYPENKIVVDYGKERSLVLLSVIDTETGVEYYKHRVKHFPIAKQMAIGDNPNTVRLLYENDTDEGVVLYYPSSQYRVKVKWEKYVEMHRARFGLTNIVIWGAFKENRYEELRRNIPEEFYDWADNVCLSLGSEYLKTKNTIPEVARDIIQGIDGEFTRKEFARYAVKHEYRALLFLWLDGRLQDEHIYDYIKPTDKTTPEQ
jgi:RNA ligase